MGLTRIKLTKNCGLQFYKVFGSGTGEGFTPYPNTRVYALLLVCESIEKASAFMDKSHCFQNYKKYSVESWTVFLKPISSRGKWDKINPFAPNRSDNMPQLANQPLAAITRATIKPSILLKFWKHEPGISQVIGQNTNVLFKIGLGEIPWFQQVTFSIWPNEDAMAKFARSDGPHAKAIQAVREGDWFAEELYARFQILSEKGSWGGKSPNLPKKIIERVI